MKRWALMQGAVCANVVEQDDPPQTGGDWVECTGLAVGPGSRLVGDEWLQPQHPSWSDPELDPRYHWLDVGPFFDRFWLKALSITSSTDPQVQGCVTLLLPRKYVDLKRADLPGMLDILVSKGLITAAEKAAVLNPVTVEYERHIKGMVQPV